MTDECGATNGINVLDTETEHVCVLTGTHDWHECACHYNWIDNVHDHVYGGDA